MSLLEGCFTAGILLVYWLFGLVMKFGAWINTYWLIGILCGGGLLLLLTTPFDESALMASTSSPQNTAEKPGFISIFKLLKYSAVIVFLLLAFSYVFIEQGLTTWLPTYNKYVLHIVDSYSVEIASLFAGGIVVGRLAGAVVMKYFNWHKVLMWCTACAVVVLAVSVYLSMLLPQHVTTELHNWLDFPLVAYFLPLTELLIGPIYPTLSSSILSSQPVRLQSSVSVLIVIFSAFGGTIGSRIVGSLFGLFGGLTAIKAPLFPLILLFMLILPYYHMLQKSKVVNKTLS
jgi:MFS transporter, FHS family, glucose/mannose:H+ symporter